MSSLTWACSGTNDVSHSPVLGRAVPDRDARLGDCLLRAADQMHTHRHDFERMEDVLSGDVPRSALGQPAGGVFGAFDGRWRGHWGDMQVEHLWWSSNDKVQLVVIRDGDTLKRGINLARGNLLCGIVLDQGAPRLHEGTLHEDGSFEWRTPRRLYLERVDGSPGQRRYEIRELDHDARTLRLVHYDEVVREEAPPVTCPRARRPES